MMIRLLYISLFIFCFFQETERKIPDVAVKNLDGKNIRTSGLSNNGKPILICFWATWCKCCKSEFNTISEKYDDWKKETGVKVITISVDDSKTSAKVAPFVNANGWDFETYLDVNQDFKRAMNVQTPPHNFLIDGKGNIVWESASYVEGSETKMYELIKKLARGEKIN